MIPTFEVYWKAVKKQPEQVRGYPYTPQAKVTPNISQKDNVVSVHRGSQEIARGEPCKDLAIPVEWSSLSIWGLL